MAEDIKVGDVIQFDFGSGEKEGTVLRLFEKTVYMSVDFPNQKGKIIKRKIADLNQDKGKTAKKGKGTKKK